MGVLAKPVSTLPAEQGRPHFVGPRALEPLRDSTVVAIDDGSGFGVPSPYRGGAPCDSTIVPLDGGSGFALPAYRAGERHWYTGMRPTPRCSRSVPEPTLKICGVVQTGLLPSAPESRTFHRLPLRNRQNKMQTQTPQPNNPPPLPSIELETEGRPLSAGATGWSPSSVRKVRVPSPFLKQSNPCLKPQNNQNPVPFPSSFPAPIGNLSRPLSFRHSRPRSGIHPRGGAARAEALPSLPRVPRGVRAGGGPRPANPSRPSPLPSAPREIPRNLSRRHSIKTATSSINVQSMFNQTQPSCGVHAAAHSPQIDTPDLRI